MTIDEVPTQSPASVQGHSVQRRNASMAARTLAFLTDLAGYFALFCGIIAVFGLPPFTRPWVVALFIVVSLALWWIQVKWKGRTWGQALWQIRSVAGAPGLRSMMGRPLWRNEPLMGMPLFHATFFTLLTLGGTAWTANSVLWTHPLWLQGPTWDLDPHVPSLGDDQWVVAPFFYTLGAWPKTYGGQPVLYSLPYAKGPPTRFVGKIIARWDAPHTQVTFYGPKTPEGAKRRDELKKCLVPSNNLNGDSPGLFSCFPLREASLAKHLEEMRSLRPKSWTLRWFHVTNPALPLAEHAQGIYLNAENERQGQDRFVFITANGTHQAVSLDYDVNAPGKVSRQIFEQAVRTVRISDELNPGRAWVDKQLQAIKLEQYSAGDFDRMASKLAEVQALLLAKISVDPKTFDAYFHLGGTAMMLTRYAMKHQQNAWTLAGKPTIQTIQSAHKYAMDIAPQDPRTTQLEGIWLDAKKLF